MLRWAAAEREACAKICDAINEKEGWYECGQAEEAAVPVAQAPEQDHRDLAARAARARCRRRGRPRRSGERGARGRTRSRGRRGARVAVDGDHPGQTREAIERALSLGAGSGQPVHLLSVQLPVSSHVGMFFAESELRGLHESCGDDEMAPARARVALSSRLSTLASPPSGRRRPAARSRAAWRKARPKSRSISRTVC